MSEKLEFGDFQSQYETAIKFAQVMVTELDYCQKFIVAHLSTA
jgi:hypothetical protein